MLAACRETVASRVSRPAAVNFCQSGPDLGGTILTAQHPSSTQVWNVQLNADHMEIDDLVAAAVVSMIEGMATNGDPGLKTDFQFVRGVLVRVTH